MGEVELEGVYTFFGVCGSLYVVLLHGSLSYRCVAVGVVIVGGVFVCCDSVVVWEGVVDFVCVVDFVGLFSVCNVRVGVFERDLGVCLSEEERMSGVLIESLFDLLLHVVEWDSVGLSILSELALSERVREQPLELHGSEV
jgi:hypothetical protein